MATVDNVQQSATDPNFVGRESAIAELNTLVSQGKKVILIQAEGGVGKTTLAYRYLNSQGFDMVLELWMAKERQNITSVESVIEEWLKRYFDEEPGREFGVSLERLRCKLGDGSKKIGVLIDNLEPTLENGRFIEAHRRYAELLRMLANPTVQSVTLITSRERLYEDGISVWLYPLRDLPKDAWDQFFEACGTHTGSSPLSDASALYQMHQAYGGNAEAMFVLSGAIQIECQGDLEVYWEENHEDLLINPTLENLVKSQFNKLQQDDEQAYRLLCRLGCYRYQAVPSVPKEGIFYLLWDVPEERRKRVVKALRDRSLVKVCNEEYYLHPVIRAEAIEKLRTSEDWETVNSKVAKFWKESAKNTSTFEEGLKRLEAYYNYVAIENWSQASEVILNDSGNGAGLLSKLRSFGYIQKCTEIINFLIKKSSITSYERGSLYAYLGDFYSITGDFQDGIYSYEEALKLRSDTDDVILYIDTVGALAFLYIKLCHYSEALHLLEKIVPYAKQMGCKGKQFLCYLYSCLSLVYFYIKNEKKSLENLTNAVKLKGYLEKSNRTWIKSYGLYTLGKSLVAHSYFDLAKKIYKNLDEYAQNMSFLLFKGFVIDGLAELEFRKCQIEEAIAKYNQALLIFQETGAKFHIAETYYYLGLAHQNLGKVRETSTSFQEAIQLFSEMEAPKQVEKVRRAMESGG